MQSKVIEHIAENKREFHKERAKLSFEEKIKIVVELQKIAIEMRKANPKRKNPEFQMVWDLNL